MTHAPDTLTTLAQMNPVVLNVLVGLFVIISGLMILVVLIQRPQGGGLGGAFGSGGGGGGGGAGQTAFGTKTGDVLTGATIGIFVLFVLFAIALNFATRPDDPSQAPPVVTAPVEDVEQGDDQDAAPNESAGDEVDGFITPEESPDTPDAQDAAQDEGEQNTQDTPAAGDVPAPGQDD